MTPSRTLPVDGYTVVIRPARWEELVELRHAVLRQGLPRDAAIFEGDDAPTSRHAAGFCEGRAVGCATFHLNGWEAEPAFQLRGMATLPEFRGQGIGRAVLEMLEADLAATFEPDASATPGPLLWCNARVPAVGFYQALGWRIVSEEFDIPTAGPHFKMIKRLAPRLKGY